MTDQRPIAFLDIETTGLDLARHEMWELAIILRRPGKEPVEGSWVFPVDLATADPMALQVNHFWERYPSARKSDAAEAAPEISAMLDGAVLVGSIPSFDAGFLDPWLRNNGGAPSWHYRLVCVESLAAGRLGMRPPWDTAEMGARLGCTKDPTTQHTAMGDARWAMKMFDALFAGEVRRPPAPLPAEGTVTAAEAGDTSEVYPEIYEAEVDVDPAEPEVALTRGRPSQTEPSVCTVCGASVPPRAALVSYARLREVRCMEPDGGCFARLDALPREET